MEYQDSEEYLVINFKENVEHKFFTKEQLFFKMIKLESQRPFVQIGNHVFQGKYCDDFIGSCLCFEEQENLRPPEIYERDSNIHLKFIAKTTKILSLQWQKVPEQTRKVDPSERVELEFSTTYANVMKQLESGSLDIEDVVKKSEVVAPISLRRNSTAKDGAHDSNSNELSSNQSEDDDDITNGTQFAQTQDGGVASTSFNKGDPNAPSRYGLLHDFIHKPLRDPEYYDAFENLSQFTNDREFNMMKEIYLKSCNYSFDDNQFLMSKGAERENLLYDFIDVKACIAAGMVEDKETFNDEECEMMLSMENFDNFTVLFKVLVLSDYLKEEKRCMANMSGIELATADVFGWTPKQRYKKMKSFRNDLKYNLFTDELAAFKKQCRKAKGTTSKEKL